MRILGIDPAYNGPCGFAVIDTREPTINMVIGVNVLTFKRGTTPESRIPLVWERARALIFGFDVTAIACEGTYQGPNARTTGGLTLVVGGLWQLALGAGLPFVRVAEAQQRGTVRSYPYELTRLWAGHLPTTHQAHVIDAIAIAQVGAPDLARQRMAA